MSECLLTVYFFCRGVKRLLKIPPQLQQKVCESGTHATQVDFSFPTPWELAGQLVQHVASTLPGLAEVRAALPPAPLVLWTCHTVTQISLLQWDREIWHKRTPEENIVAFNIILEPCQVYMLNIFFPLWLHKSISPGVVLGICGRLCPGSTWRHTVAWIKLPIAKTFSEFSERMAAQTKLPGRMWQWWTRVHGENESQGPEDGLLVNHAQSKQITGCFFCTQGVQPTLFLAVVVAPSMGVGDVLEWKEEQDHFSLFVLYGNNI